VNGEHLPNSAQLTADAEDQPLPQYRLQAVVNDSEYLLLSDLNPQSFDARYFGLIARDQIRKVVRPIFTWSH
jgi:type IV secretory pathway protease TraF